MSRASPGQASRFFETDGPDVLREELDAFLRTSARKGAYEQQCAAAVCVIAAAEREGAGGCEALSVVVRELNRIYTNVTCRLHEKPDAARRAHARQELNAVRAQAKALLAQRDCQPSARTGTGGKPRAPRVAPSAAEIWATGAAAFDVLRAHCAEYRSTGSSRHLCARGCYLLAFEPARRLQAVRDALGAEAEGGSCAAAGADARRRCARLWRAELGVRPPREAGPSAAAPRCESLLLCPCCAHTGRRFESVPDALRHAGLPAAPRAPAPPAGFADAAGRPSGFGTPCTPDHRPAGGPWEEGTGARLGSGGSGSASDGAAADDSASDPAAAGCSTPGRGTPSPQRQAKRRRPAPPCRELLSPYFKERTPRRGLRASRLQRAPPSPLGLLEELVAEDGWRLLVVCVLLNQTTRAQVDPVAHALFGEYAHARALADADEAQLASLLRPLGLHQRRARGLRRLSEAWLEDVWARPDELPGVGKYGADAFAIFHLGRWDEVVPSDHALNWYWRWVRGELPLLAAGDGDGIEAAATT